MSGARARLLTRSPATPTDARSEPVSRSARRRVGDDKSGTPADPLPRTRSPSTRLRSRRRPLFRLRAARLSGGTAVTMLGLFALPFPSGFAWESGQPRTSRPDIRLLDTLTVPAGTSEAGMPFGGLSGLDYDPSTHTYLALCDDRSENGKARFYTLELPLDGKRVSHSAFTDSMLDTLATLSPEIGSPESAPRRRSW